ncbi:hypothetical protein [Pedobacter sp. AJM]|uniref:hypothetical protein n=1 Tax=Pedobacter sp. AJM TaxID=2003629 RepID=UPI000B4B361F|nr:hypothetical protein [Pedobacter sp. AJM]OWK70102.1 hypothetical protein CBW18_14075 [Pedobacter sp. AJM]
MKLIIKKTILFFAASSLILLVIVLTGFTEKKTSDYGSRSKLFVSMNTNMLQNVDRLVKWSAKDSTKLSKDKSLISLYGSAKFTCGNFDIFADEIFFNKKLKKITAKNYKMISFSSKKVTEGQYGEFDINKSY